MITTQMVMGLKPCWSAQSIERAFAKADCSSWASLVVSARDDGWATCLISDMSWLLSNYAALYYPEVLTAWVVAAVHQRAASQKLRWSGVTSPKSTALRDQLASWQGDKEAVSALLAEANAEVLRVGGLDGSVLGAVVATAVGATAAHAIDFVEAKGPSAAARCALRVAQAWGAAEVTQGLAALARRLDAVQQGVSHNGRREA